MSRPDLGPAGLLLAAAVALPPLAGMTIVLTRFLPHADVAYYLSAARELASGELLYRDIGDVNQPSIYWVHLAAHRLSELLGIADRTVLALLLLLASWGSLLLAWRLLHSLSRGPVAGFLFAGSWALGLLALDIHGEREQWAVAGLLPWTATAALRLCGRRPPPRLAVAAGIAAGVAVTLKLPYLLLPLVVLEALLLLRRILPWRVEALAGVLAAASLFGLQLWIHPAYLERVLPEALIYYEALAGSPWDQLARRGVLLPLLPFAVALVAAHWMRRSNDSKDVTAGSLSAAALAVAGGFLLAFLLQAKGFAYHWMPVLAFGLAASGAQLRALATGRSWAARLAASAVALLPLWCLYLGWQQWRAAPEAWPAARQLAEEIAVRAEASEAPLVVYGLSPEIYPLFPAITLAGAEWAMAESHLWQLDGLYRLQPAPDESGAFRPPARQGEAEAALRRRLVVRFVETRPDLVAVFDGSGSTIGGSPFSYLDYLRADGEFAAGWEGYRPVGRMGEYLLYERGDLR